MESNKITIKIKDKAKEIGFDLVGITSTEVFSRAADFIKGKKLNRFIDNDKDLLTNPKKHLKSASSIIALALSYASKEKEPNNNQYISLYARRKDYHTIMEKKLKDLKNYIKTLENSIEMISYCDTGSILDREVAYRAGLGWIGKSNNLINPKFGSYIILAEIITNLDLEYDDTIQSNCNDCNLCIEKCPAQAFKGEYNLDSEKCLSYLTQKKGYLKENERNNIGNKLWGCDTCLSVCPYNKSIPRDIHPEFKENIEANVDQIMKFSKKTIPKEWKDSAISWRGIRVLKRNTLINIANSANEEYIPLLIEQLNNPSPILRTYVVWALGQMNDDSIKGILRTHYFSESDEIVLEEIENLFKNNKWGDLND